MTTVEPEPENDISFFRLKFRHLIGVGNPKPMDIAISWFGADHHMCDALAEEIDRQMSQHYTDHIATQTVNVGRDRGTKELFFGVMGYRGRPLAHGIIAEITGIGGEEVGR